MPYNKGADALLSHLAAPYIDLLPKVDETTISKTAPNTIPEPPMVVATLVSNTVQVLLTGLAAQRLGHAYMHISPLNSDVPLFHSCIQWMLKCSFPMKRTSIVLLSLLLRVTASGLFVWPSLILYMSLTMAPNSLISISVQMRAPIALLYYTLQEQVVQLKPIWWPNKGVMHIAPLSTHSVILSTSLV